MNHPKSFHIDPVASNNCSKPINFTSTIGTQFHSLDLVIMPVAQRPLRVFFASAHQTRCSNCNLGVSKHCASSRKRGATPLSSTLAMGGFCSMPRSNNAGLGKPAINCMVNNLNYITPACIYLSKSVTVLCLGQDFGAMEQGYQRKA